MSSPIVSPILRPELTPMPERIQALPVFRGYPVPWFVKWLDNGEPEFRVVDGRKWRAAVKEKRCWVCGQKLGSYLVFTLGPMCGITRTTSEPPCHKECAEWSVHNCPFITRPHMVRREGDLPEGAMAPGHPIYRNPGVMLLWTTRDYTLFPDRAGGKLIRVGDPLEISTWAEGRKATGEELQTSIDGGFPKLLEVAEMQGREAIRELLREKAAFLEVLRKAMFL